MRSMSFYRNLIRAERTVRKWPQWKRDAMEAQEKPIERCENKMSDILCACGKVYSLMSNHMKEECPFCKRSRYAEGCSTLLDAFEKLKEENAELKHSLIPADEHIEFGTISQIPTIHLSVEEAVIGASTKESLANELRVSNGRDKVFIMNNGKKIIRITVGEEFFRGTKKA